MMPCEILLLVLLLESSRTGGLRPTSSDGTPSDSARLQEALLLSEKAVERDFLSERLRHLGS